MSDEPKHKKSVSWSRFRALPLSRGDIGRSVGRLSKDARRHTRRFVSSRLDRLSTIKRMVLGWVVLVTVLAVVSLAQWVGFRSAYMTEAVSAGGTFSEGVLGPLETLNPLFARSSAEKSAAKLLFAGLYTYDSTGSLKSDLAESVAINETETEYTVTLRSGAVWSDGAPLTAHDVVFTVELLKNPATGAEISGWQLLKAEALDDKTIKFILPGAYAPFLHSLTFPVVPKHVLGEIKPAELREQSFSQSPITSGPFAFRLMQSVSTDESKKVLHLVANPTYLHGAPLLERFQLNAYGSREDIEKALKTNEIIATPELTYGNLPEPMQKMFNSTSHGISDGVFAIFNMRDGILQNGNVRQALALSVNRNKVREKLSQPTAALEGPILTSQIAGELSGFGPQDVQRAKELLDNEGWVVSGDVRRKDDRPLTINMVALRGAGFDQVTEGLAQAWREQLQVKVDVQIVDPLDPSQSVLQTILQPRNFDVLVYELVLGGDPDVYAYWHSSQAHSSGLNFANYSSIIADDALSGGRTKRNEKYRADRYRAFVRRWMADTPAIPLYQPKIDYITSHSVTAMSDDTQLVASVNRYADVIYWAASSRPVYKTP